MDHPLKPPQDPRKLGHPDEHVQSKASASNIKLWILTGVIIAALLVVLLVLPKMVAETQTSPTLKPEEKSEILAVSEQAPVTPTETIDPVASQTRINAEQALQSFLRLQVQPELTNAKIWAQETWTSATATAAAGDKAFGAEKYNTAVSNYRTAVEDLQTLVDERDQILSQYLTSAWEFLTDNALDEARHAFDQVLAMEADHQQAQLGLQQTAAREQVLRLMQAGKQAEITDSLPQAADAYTAALQLDPHYLAAEEGLRRVTTELQQRAFQDAMGRALLSLDKGMFSTAEKALQQAAAIYPDDESLKQARHRLLTDRRQASLNSLRRQSELSAGNEDWTTAALKYHKALAIDPQAAFARNGLAKAMVKIKLHEQLDHYLADTTRLYSNDPLENAQKLLASNPRPAAEPKLAAKLVGLKRAVELAITPVNLLITSDNLTQISIYKVGRQGVFMQKQFSLRPGKYTITGARKGYRDVLKVMDLKPAINGQRISIRTEEKF